MKRQNIYLSSALKDYQQSIQNSRSIKIGKLTSAWEKIASPQALEHTNNIVLDKKDESIVLIYMDDTVWVAECDMSREVYKVLLKNEVNFSINNVKFLMTKNSKFSKTFKKSEKKRINNEIQPDVVLSKEQLEKIRFETEKINDNKVRESAYKAMKSNYEWKISLKKDNCR